MGTPRFTPEFIAGLEGNCMICWMISEAIGFCASSAFLSDLVI